MGSLLINPVITGGLLYLLTNAPEQYRLPVVGLIESKISLDKVVLGIKALLSLGIIRQINIRLNALSFNHWQLSTRKSNWNFTNGQEIAVVTGGCMGIGRGIVDNLRAKGVRVAIWDWADLPAELKGRDGIMYTKVDISDPEAVHEAAEAVRAKFGPPSIVVNNAGIQNAGPNKLTSILETENQYTKKLFEVNMLAHYYIVKEFLPDMLKKDKGHIVGVASMASFIGMPGIIGYSCTKAGVLAFMEGLAGELKWTYKKRGVVLTTVHPAYVATPLVSSFSKETNVKIDGAVTIDAIGKVIAKQIYSCRGAQLIVPDATHVKIGTLLRAMPNWLQEGMRDIAINNTPNPSKLLAARNKF